ncbi:tetratricopeptide repeat-containing sensor histidine kinase [Sunxiuqinia dokdonensis]|uniref:histidine kinase n=1 Tax=Sunxiuqinia dokdonensis TaxID=1409788 RepID=A0A0L8V4E9_9BACT|nr:tetratricopeptide repeat protein [Sunxiuqinia dokdonensis]KOH43365.1 histidine kinase [Sunxiuqinia dokdonensis]
MARRVNKLVFIGITVLISVLGGTCQPIEKDSIQQLLASTSDDSAKTKILLQLARSSNNKQKTLQYYAEALQYENNKLRTAEITDTLGLFNLQLGNYQEAMTYFKQAKLLFYELQDSLWMGKIHNNIAVVHWGLGNSIEALSNYQKALSIRQAIKDHAGICKVMNNIGLVYQDLGLYEDALDWHQKALAIALAINDSYAIAYSYSNIGQYYEYHNRLDEALKTYVKGFNALPEANTKNRFDSFLSSNIGSVYEKMNQPDSALFHYHNAATYGNRISNSNRIAIAQHHLGKIHLKLDQLDSAKYYINSSMQLSRSKNYPPLIRDNLFTLSEIEEREGRISSAMNYYKQASTLKDSLFSTENIEKLNDLQIKFFTGQQEQENQLLRKNNEIQRITIKQQKMVSHILITGGLLILLVLFIVIRSHISLKKLSQRLEESERALLKVNADKDKFFTIIAHDLKSPFSGFLGTTDLLVDDFDQLPTDSVKRLLAALKDSSSNLYALLESLLQWAQVQTGSMHYQFGECDVHQIATSVTNLLVANAKQKQITLIQTIQSNTLVYADEKSVATILRNLISNAIKYTKSGDQVLVEAVRKGSVIEISVSDNGIGMNAETCEKLFDITKKTSQQGTKNESGTGLGLILCKEFVEKNKGQIWVESEVGKGSKFTFSLPVPIEKQIQQ